ncbi:MAG: hypothetical protein ABI835_15820 [Chloroflexota bacterium]
MRKFLVLAICLFAVLGSALVVSAQDEAHEWACSLPFEATVLTGPDAELSLVGTVGLDVDEFGSASGLLTTDTDLEVPIVGQINGRAINLAFDLGDDVYIFGLGTSVESIGAESCGLSLGGPFVGPAPDDTGTWLAGRALEKIREAAAAE